MSMPKCARAELAAQKTRVKQSRKILVIAAHLLSRGLASNTVYPGNDVKRVMSERKSRKNDT
jgi:hypothetical protein